MGLTVALARYLIPFHQLHPHRQALPPFKILGEISCLYTYSINQEDPGTDLSKMPSIGSNNRYDRTETLLIVSNESS